MEGANSVSSWSRWSAKSRGSSSAMTVLADDRPCLMGLCETMALPCAVRGPVDFWALRRLAMICF